MGGSEENVKEPIIYDIALNDLDLNYWIYTDINGYVTRIDETDADVVEKFKSADKDENELIGVSKSPIMKDGRVDENRLDLLNLDELEKCLFSKSFGKNWY